jgi:hypothetical protein
VVHGRIKRRFGQIKYKIIQNGLMTKSTGGDLFEKKHATPVQRQLFIDRKTELFFLI